MTRVPIAVDIGNSTIKLGVPRHTPREEPPDWSLLLHWDTSDEDVAPMLRQLPEDAHVWHVASVHRPSEQRLANAVSTLRPQDEYHLLSYQDLPLEMDVEYPGRVGMDRLVMAVAANRRGAWVAAHRGAIPPAGAPSFETDSPCADLHGALDD